MGGNDGNGKFQGTVVARKSQEKRNEEKQASRLDGSWRCFVRVSDLPARMIPRVAVVQPCGSGARTVQYGETDIIPIHAKLRFSTLIVLPADEEILDATTGDKEFWIINGAHNLCYLHPAQQGIRSNLNLITASGHVYSFLLTEISKDPNEEPDLKVFVERKEVSTIQGNLSSACWLALPKFKRTKPPWMRHGLSRRRPSSGPGGRAKGNQPISGTVSPETSIRLHVRRKSEAAALFRFRHLSRRQIHLHQVERRRKNPRSMKSRTASPI